MNYQNLDNEMKEYFSYFKQCESITLKFSNFFKQFTQAGVKFILTSKKSLSEFTEEVNKVEYFPSTLNRNINNYCEEFNEILDKLQNVFSNIEKDIIIKINDFDKNFKLDIKNSLNKLNELNIYLSENNAKLEKTKNNYFDSCKEVQNYNKKYILNKSPTKDYIDQFDKLKQISETKKVYYRIEVTKLNDLLLSNESHYNEILNSISKQEEDRGLFFTNILLLLNNNLKHFNFESKDIILKNEKFIDDIYTKRDIKMFSLYFNKTNNNKDKTRFLYEEFFDYENINSIDTNIELKQNDDRNNMNKVQILKENKISDILEIDFNLAQTLYQIGKSNSEFYVIDDKECLELDNIIADLIQNKEKIADEKFLFIIKLVEEKNDGCKIFIYRLMSQYLQKSIIKFNSIQNIFLLNSILNILLNFIWENNAFTYLALFLIYIGEHTLYYDQNTKYQSNYLCKIMSKNTIYRIIDFWSRTINLKIKILARIKLNEEFKLRKKNSKRKDSGFLKIFGGTTDDYDEIENEILYSQLYKENSSYFLNEVLNEYLNHFICYDFNKAKIFELIEEISDQYCLNIKQKNYFINYIKSNMIYINSPNPYFLESKSLKNKYHISFKKIKNKKIKIFLFAIKFLSKNDIMSLNCLNKECHKTIKKYFYKNILVKQHTKIDYQKHISIWKLLLGYNELKEKYNYNSLKESIINNSKDNNKIIISKIKEKEFETIELDCIRTTFKKNQEQNQAKLCNILKVSALNIPKVSYCQGMNHIASFLLVLCEENEEEAFYLFLCILVNTDYCNIIDDNLDKLNSFFYCFERLLNLMFPEMYNFFMSNNINGGYYLSSWFITLFTLAFNCEKENNNKEIIMKLFDLFIFCGWKAVFKIGLSLIKYEAIQIFSLSYEQSVHYLNNNIIHSKLFNNENIDELMNVFINFKISNNLLSNISEEYEKKKNILNKNNLS